jgi:hypothetical protein
MDNLAPDSGDELRRLLAAQHASAEQTLAAAGDMARLLSRFRAHLILGGFTPEDATELAHDWFLRLLDSAEPEP